MTPRKPKARPVEAWALVFDSGAVHLTNDRPVNPDLGRVVHLREVAPSDAQAARDDARVIRLAAEYVAHLGARDLGEEEAQSRFIQAVELRSKHLKGKR